MNLIVTDFDGTFFDDNYLENIKFINSIKNEYDFIIATGRNYPSLKSKLKINCKYYICNDGGYILDSNEKIIYKNDFDKNTSDIIIDRIKNITDRDYNVDNILHMNKDVKENINKIIVKRNYIDDLEIMNKIIDGIPDVYAYLSENVINISPKKSKKGIAIEELLKLNKYDKIFVVGNDINDYEMIRKYNGYLVSNNENKNFKTINNFLKLKKEL